MAVVTRFDDVRRKPTPFQKVTELQVGRCENGGKIKYASKADARRAARIMPGRQGGRKNRPYECPSCRFWHLTSQAQAA